MKTTKQLSGNEKTRGEYGVRAEVAHRVIWDPEINEYRPVAEGDAHSDEWGVFDPDFGWMVGEWLEEEK